MKKVAASFLLIVMILSLWGVAYIGYEYYAGDAISFEDEQLETAVRQQLQLEDSETIDEALIETVTELDLSDKRITDLRGLEEFHALHDLDLSGNNEITDYEPLSELSSLQNLTIADNRLNTLSFVENFPTLQSLDVQGNRIESLEPLHNHRNLESLNIRDNRLTDISEVEFIPNLRELNLRGNYIEDVSPLHSLTYLEDLNLRYNAIKDLQPLENLDSLTTRLYVEGNPLHSIEPILPLIPYMEDFDINEPEHYIEISQRGGVFTDNPTVEMNVLSEEAAIHYTLDGTPPTPQSPVYEDPLEIDESTVIRARAMTEGGLEGPELTESYILDEEHDLPVIAISTDPKNFFSDDEGIYVPGDNFDPEADEEAATGNYAMRGREWEREVKFDYFVEQEAEAVISQNIGVRVHGGGSRAYDQKSLRLYARSDYGNNRLNFPFFGEDYDHLFDRLILRNSGQDYNSTMLRDAYGQRLVDGATNLDTQAYQPTVVYINGEYWGIQNLRERQDENYFDRKHGIEEEDLDFLEQDGIIRSGRNAGWHDLIDEIDARGVNDDEMWNRIEREIDLDNVIDFNVTQIYMRNTDWPGNNLRYYRDRAVMSPWRYILFDLDHGLARFGTPHAFRHHTLHMATEEGQDSMPNPDWSTFLLRNLLEKDEFRHDFIHRMTYYTDTLFHPQRANAILEEMTETIRGEMPAHIERWEHPTSMDDWETNIRAISEYMEERPDYMRLHLAEHFDLDGFASFTMDEPTRENVAIAGLEAAHGDIDAEQPLHWMTNVPISFSYSAETISLETDNESVIDIIADNTIVLEEEGEARLTINNEQDEVLGSILINVEHFEIETEELVIGETLEVPDEEWQTSDEEILAASEESETVFEALSPGKSLLTQQDEEDGFTEIIRVEVTE